MKTKVTRIVDSDEVKLEVIESEPGVHDYGIPRQSWIRGVKLMRRFGAETALNIIDERANRAAERKNYDSARRWRTLITAIHAIQENEPLPGQNIH